MRKYNLFATLALVLFAVLTLGGCGEKAEETSAEPNRPNGGPAANPQKTLVVYFSHSFGNTREIARMIQAKTGGDIFEVKPKTPYPTVHQEVVAQARREIDAGFQPEIVAMPDDLDRYEVIFVGTPNWWNTMAPPIATFLAAHDFSGKTLIPFTTHGGSGLGRYPDEMKKLCPHADILTGAAFSRNSIPESGDAVAKWIDQILPATRK